MDTTGTGKHEETLEENLDHLYLGTTTRHQWQVLMITDFILRYIVKVNLKQLLQFLK